MHQAFKRQFCINNNSCIFITRAFAKVSVIQIRAVDEHDSVRRSKKESKMLEGGEGVFEC